MEQEQQKAYTFDLSTISNEQTSSLPALTFQGEIIVVDREEMVDAACRDLAASKIIGFDTETRPSFKAGITYKVSLLQLSTSKRCYLFRLNKISFSDPIVNLLQSNDIIKLGADIAGDIRSLNQLRVVNEGGFYDLQSHIWEWGIGEKSLRKMAALVLGHRVSKAQRLSNWEAVQFTPQQKIYAATDAWVCIEIYNKLLETPKLTEDQIAKIRAEQARLATEAAAKRAAKRAAAAKAGYTKSDRPRYRRKRGSKTEVSNNTKKIV